MLIHLGPKNVLTIIRQGDLEAGTHEGRQEMKALNTQSSDDIPSEGVLKERLAGQVCRSQLALPSPAASEEINGPKKVEDIVHMTCADINGHIGDSEDGPRGPEKTQPGHSENDMDSNTFVPSIANCQSNDVVVGNEHGA